MRTIVCNRRESFAMLVLVYGKEPRLGRITNRTRTSTLEGWNPNHWTTEAVVGMKRGGLYVYIFAKLIASRILSHSVAFMQSMFYLALNIN